MFSEFLGAEEFGERGDPAQSYEVAYRGCPPGWWRRAAPTAFWVAECLQDPLLAGAVSDLGSGPEREAIAAQDDNRLAPFDNVEALS
jgi:hypothetical protein